MKGNTVRIVVGAAGLIAIAALATWKFWPKTDGKANGQEQSQGRGPATRPGGAKALDKAGALKAYKDGLALYNAEKVIDARDKLSEAFFSGQLSAGHEAQLVPIMAELAEKTLLSGNFYDGDPYVLRRTIEKGDTLTKLVQSLELRVPWRMLAKINNLPESGGVIREGAGLTLVQGPFHAIVRKSRFTMDMYLHRAGLPKVFVRRFKVGIGSQANPTPDGLWAVPVGGKQDKTPWYPPGSAVVRRKLQWSEPGYPLGKRGYWIPLTGKDPTNRTITGIGIHGTNDPTSVGKAQSLGCMRLLDDDIEWAFAMLYDKWSTVLVLP